MKKLLTCLLILALAGCAAAPINPNWSEADQANVIHKRVTVGMDRDQVRAAWGNPWITKKADTGDHITELWEYGGLGPYGGKTWVFFRDGVVYKMVR